MHERMPLIKERSCYLTDLLFHSDGITQDYVPMHSIIHVLTNVYGYKLNL